jgi:acetylglutamate kinase
MLTVLGVRLVVVLGSRQGIDNTIRAAGGQVRYVDGLRVTDVATMQAAIQAAGAARMEFEASLSKVKQPGLLPCDKIFAPQTLMPCVTLSKCRHGKADAFDIDTHCMHHSFSNFRVFLIACPACHINYWQL